jgi:hypothetical protein
MLGNISIYFKVLSDMKKMMLQGAMIITTQNLLAEVARIGF